MVALGQLDSPIPLHRPSLLIPATQRASHIGYRWPREFDMKEYDKESMARLWEDCQPFVVKNAIELFDPDTFISGARCQDCTTTFLDRDDRWNDSRSTLSEYFRLWKPITSASMAVQIRVSASCRDPLPFVLVIFQSQDYPPDNDLENVHPPLFAAFKASLRNLMPIYTMPSGPLNLASYHPIGSNPPDLGKLDTVYSLHVIDCVYRPKIICCNGTSIALLMNKSSQLSLGRSGSCNHETPSGQIRCSEHHVLQ